MSLSLTRVAALEGLAHTVTELRNNAFHTTKVFIILSSNKAIKTEPVY